MIPLRQMASRWKIVLGTALSFMAVLGIFTFPLFILEEATQMTVWGTWQADRNNLYILKEGIRVVEKLNATSKAINNIGGWLHPLSFLSYRGWHQATDFWIMASKTKILALDPRLLDGQEIHFLFEWKTEERTATESRLINGNIIVTAPPGNYPSLIEIQGACRWKDNRLFITSAHISMTENYN
ncbi:MAG: hypothetical protein LLG06_04115 [Desulfobacteraceae bacterium]|nr:hypothetical protein [Desulfobacteraceae bacterium]